jgi:glycosyltransferase involved in cell wall biosynthesis
MDDLISVVIPTRNRAHHFPDCVDAVLANTDCAYNVIVIDQSEDDRTECAIERLIAEGRVVYRRSSERGVAKARNLGWRSGDAPLIAYTDDDCRVDSDWVGGLRKQMARGPGIGIVYARVYLPDVVETGGFGSSFDPVERLYDGSLPGPKAPWGISANMLVRRSLLERLGGFDEALGAGGLFRSGAETDLTIRATGAGYKILHSREPSVLHLGVRDASNARLLMESYAFGMGATLGKHLRLASRPGRSQLPQWLAHYSLTVATNALLGRRPLRAVWLQGMLKGAWAARRTPISRISGRYEP